MTERLFRDQAVTISQSGSEVRIQCTSENDAIAVFDWLTKKCTGPGPHGNMYAPSWGRYGEDIPVIMKCKDN